MKKNPNNLLNISLKIYKKRQEINKLQEERKNTGRTYGYTETISKLEKEINQLLYLIN